MRPSREGAEDPHGSHLSLSRLLLARGAWELGLLLGGGERWGDGSTVLRAFPVGRVGGHGPAADGDGDVLSSRCPGLGGGGL